MTLDQELKIRDLELAEVRLQNLTLGARVVELETETISQRQRIVELEAKLALDQRSKMSDQISAAREQANQAKLEAKAQAAEAFGVDDTEDLTAAKLRGV